MTVCDYLLSGACWYAGERQGPVLRAACLCAREPQLGGCPFVWGLGWLWACGTKLRKDFRLWFFVIISWLCWFMLPENARDQFSGRPVFFCARELVWGGLPWVLGSLWGCLTKLRKGFRLWLFVIISCRERVSRLKMRATARSDEIRQTTLVSHGRVKMGA